MIAYVVVVVLVILLAYIAYYYFTGMLDEPSLGPSAGPSPGQTELIITENGASMSEGYRIMPMRENYIQMPEVQNCGTDRAPEYCSAYESSDTNGFALMYDLNIQEPGYTSCPGGGHDCWFIEKYDNEGTLISVVNKNGDSILDMIADDVWNNKWSSDHQMVQEVSRMIEFKDGKLMAKGEIDTPHGNINAGDVIKPVHFPASAYFIILFTAMKTAGAEKPSKITLNVKNARDAFNTAKERSSRAREPSESNATPPEPEIRNDE
jgi:hypothetical protein